MACLTRPPRFPPFFPSPLKGERGISGPGGTVSGGFGDFRGVAEIRAYFLPHSSLVRQETSAHQWRTRRSNNQNQLQPGENQP